jgi:hypothetical protein
VEITEKIDAEITVKVSTAVRDYSMTVVQLFQLCDQAVIWVSKDKDLNIFLDALQAVIPVFTSRVSYFMDKDRKKLKEAKRKKLLKKIEEESNAD